MCAHALDGLVAGQAAELAGVFQDAVACERFGHRAIRGELAIGRAYHGSDRDAVLAAELKVPLVVGRHGHDRARAVAHDNEVAHPNRHVRSAIRVHRVASREEADLFEVVGALSRRFRR